MASATPDEAPLLSRGETAVRILLTLIFYVALRVALAVLAVVVVFELLYTLVSRQPPPSRLRTFANRTLGYIYEALRYVSYNRVDAPFPFEDFPPEVEPTLEDEDLTGEPDFATGDDEDTEEALETDDDPSLR